MNTGFVHSITMFFTATGRNDGNIVYLKNKLEI
jgi:hypothetical protein